MEMISLDVTKNTLRASTPKKYAPTHPSLASTWHLPDPLRVVQSRLAMYLPHEVNEKEGSVPCYNVVVNNTYCKTKKFIDASKSDVDGWHSTVSNNSEVVC